MAVAKRAVGPVEVATVAVVAIAVYLNTLGGALFYDDTNAVIRNTWVHAGDPLAIVANPSWWTPGHGRAWRPVTTLTFAANYALHGLAPTGYHVVNLALHALVSVLVLAVFAAATGAALAAWVAALLFAAHPVHTEAVASVVGRAELLAATGFFIGWWCWVRAGAAARPAPWVAGALLALFAGLLSKENAIALVPVALATDLVRARGTPLGATLRRAAPRWAVLVATAAAYALLRARMVGGDAPAIDRLDNPLVALGGLERGATTVKVIGLYAWQLLVPLRLSADYSFAQIAPPASPLDPFLLLGLAVLVAVPAGLWWGWRRSPALVLGLVVLVAAFAPIGNVLFPIGTIMAERLLYLPSAGFCFVAGLGFATLAGPAELAARPAAGDGRAARRARARSDARTRGAARGAPPAAAAPGAGRPPGPVSVAASAGPAWRAALAHPALGVGLALVLALYAVRTWTRNAVWQAPAVFFTTMVTDAPRSARSHRELGTMLADQGRYAEARQAFERALAIKPNDGVTLFNLGNALTGAGDLAGAVDAYRQAVADRPRFRDALSNLGNAESLRGNQEAAIAAFEQGLAVSPGDPGLLMNLANTHFKAGEPARARQRYQEALAIAPDDPGILTNYGVFLFAQGDADGALAAYGKAAASPTGPPMAWVGVVATHRAKGDRTAAERAQAEAESRFPADPSVRQMREVLRRDAAGAR